MSYIQTQKNPSHSGEVPNTAIQILKTHSEQCNIVGGLFSNNVMLASFSIQTDSSRIVQLSWTNMLPGMNNAISITRIGERDCPPPPQ